MGSLIMKLYLNIDSIPEMLELTPSERRLVLHSCKPEVWQNWKMWFGAAICSIIGLVFAFGSLAILLSVLPSKIKWLYFINGLMSGAIGMGIAWWLTERVMTNLLRPYMAKHIEEMQNRGVEEPVDSPEI